MRVKMILPALTEATGQRAAGDGEAFQLDTHAREGPSSARVAQPFTADVSGGTLAHEVDLHGFRFRQ